MTKKFIPLAALAIAVFSASPAFAYGGYRGGWHGGYGGPRGSLAFGFGGYAPYYPGYYAPAYYPYPAYYAPPPTVVYAPQPAPVVYSQPAPPMSANQTSPTYTDSNGQTCREYQSTALIDGHHQSTYGTACLQPDGTWRVMN